MGYLLAMTESDTCPRTTTPQAVNLYLDVINLFYMVLALTGGGASWGVDACHPGSFLVDTIYNNPYQFGIVFSGFLDHLRVPA